MGLSQSVMHPAFAYHHRPAADSANLGRVHITRVLTEGKWNPVTGLIDGETVLDIYLGPARVNKIARAIRHAFVDDSEDYQNVRVSLSFDKNEVPWQGLQSNDRVLIVDGGADPAMSGESLYVHGWLGSTNAWQRTLICRFNSKQ
jgi:hypothetical protein